MSSLYTNTNNISYFFKKYKYFILGIIILVLLIFLIQNLNLEKSPIKAKFSNNPLNLNENQNTILSITVNNNTQEDITNAKVKISYIQEEFNIFCKNGEFPEFREVNIDKIGSKNKRVIDCDIRVINQEILKGTYSFDINYIIQDNSYHKRVDLEIV